MGIWWLYYSVLPESAPCHDLNLINSILQFKVINQRAAKGALKGIGNHLWYLTEELLPLSLFSKNVSEDTKAKIARKILSSGPEAKSMRTGASHGKPVFPTMPERVNEDLVQFVGPSSIKFFNIMRLDPWFLLLPVEIWELDSSFNEAKLTVSNLMVVNDAAERGIKLSHDYIKSSKQEGILQNIPQGVENVRARVPDMRQREEQTKENKWFLPVQYFVSNQLN